MFGFRIGGLKIIEKYLKFLLKNHIETKKYREGIEEEKRKNYYSWNPFGN
ncbi:MULTISPECIES: hypothetical protein [Clostridium]|uniref:Glyoxalase/bleomycin resistance protein/dioxygenase n=1 Tax=Clostridium botulinum B str. Osaka05 TaxID=1407017 RepID=A0A060N9X7_CLOBO|nr:MULTISPECIES: hypothetical protein [Clostridium]BAO05154.1 glyoxalase/bleomycin resistance protein/dioxygenase [Clostridium botulinum B str. Osaka05]